MKRDEVLKTIENKMKNDSDIFILCKQYFPMENFEHGSSGLIDDMYTMLIDISEEDNSIAEDIYFFLTDEKITIDEDEFYSEEEIDHG